MHACGNDVGYFRDALGVTLVSLSKPPSMSAWSLELSAIVFRLCTCMRERINTLEEERNV